MVGLPGCVSCCVVSDSDLWPRTIPIITNGLRCGGYGHFEPF